MNSIPIDRDSAAAALDRLIDVAQSHTGQGGRVANFLLAWWNGDDWGHFPIADLFGLDRDIAADITTIVGFLGQHPQAVYADAFDRRDEIERLIHRWRKRSMVMGDFTDEDRAAVAAARAPGEASAFDDEIS